MLEPSSYSEKFLVPFLGTLENFAFIGTGKIFSFNWDMGNIYLLLGHWKPSPSIAISKKLYLLLGHGKSLPFIGTLET